MGTRGFFGFIYRGKYYVVYNHFDSYDLYGTLVREIRQAMADGTFSQWPDKVTALRCVDPSSGPPTPEDIARLAPYTDLAVSGCSPNDWYCLLRKTQGSFVKVLEAGMLINQAVDNTVPLDGLFIEYTVLLELDNNTIHYNDLSLGHRFFVRSIETALKGPF